MTPSVLPMPTTPVIQIAPHSSVVPFEGGCLQIQDRSRLVSLVARIVIGRYQHVDLVLRGQSATRPTVTLRAIENAKRKLSPPANDGMRWRRDGWVFQLISWIAIRSGSSSRTMSIPHMQPGRHGFDCLYVDEVDKPLLTICEDKATESPRGTIRDEVLPEFAKFEEGERDDELQSELTSLLCQRLGEAKTEKVIESIQWDSTRRYCATVTASTQEAARPANLYNGYDGVVTGGDDRRIGHLFAVDGLRAWMDAFCVDVLKEIDTMTP